MGGVGALYIGARAVTMRHSASQPRDGHNITKDDDGQPYPLLTTTGENENRPSAQTAARACLQPRATGPLRFPSPPLRRHSARGAHDDGGGAQPEVNDGPVFL